MPRNYRPATAVYVNMTVAGTTIKYGFLGRLNTASQNDLGHVAMSSLTDVTGLVFKANYPKPPRASKAAFGGIISSFIDAAKITTAKAAGWKITPGKGKGGIGATTKYVSINGIKYAWNFAPLPAGVTAPDLTAADIKTAGANDVVVFGASFPKPPRMKIEISDADENLLGSYFSTFVDLTKVDALKTAGWSNAGKARVSKADLEMLAKL